MKLAALRVYVHRLPRAHDFYHRQLGLPVRVDGRAQGWCVYALGEVDLVVEAVAPDAPEDEQALVGRVTGIALHAGDLRALQRELAARGVPFEATARALPGGGQVAGFEDPDGNLLQLVQPPAP